MLDTQVSGDNGANDGSRCATAHRTKVIGAGQSPVTTRQPEITNECEAIWVLAIQGHQRLCELFPFWQPCSCGCLERCFDNEAFVLLGNLQLFWRMVAQRLRLMVPLPR